MFPGEPEPPWIWMLSAATRRVGVGGDGAGQAGRDRQAVRVVRRGPQPVIHNGPRRLDIDQHVGTPVLDGLERADRAAELDPGPQHAGPPATPRRTAELLGRQVEGRQSRRAAAPRQRRHRRRQVGRERTNVTSANLRVESIALSVLRSIPSASLAPPAGTGPPQYARRPAPLGGGPVDHDLGRTGDLPPPGAVVRAERALRGPDRTRPVSRWSHPWRFPTATPLQSRHYRAQPGRSRPARRSRKTAHRTRRRPSPRTPRQARPAWPRCHRTARESPGLVTPAGRPRDARPQGRTRSQSPWTGAPRFRPNVCRGSHARWCGSCSASSPGRKFTHLPPRQSTTSKANGRLSGPFAIPAAQRTAVSGSARRRFVIRLNSSSKAIAIWILAK